jgi:hypothetical protein
MIPFSKWPLALALLLGGCKSDRAPAAAKNPGPESSAASTHEASSRSPDKVLKLPEKVRKFSLACGKDSLKVFHDDTTDYANGVAHLLREEFDFPAGYFIERIFNGRGDWLFVSRTSCAEIPLFGAVVFNPSRTRFAALGQDNAAGIGEKGPWERFPHRVP